MEELRKAVIAYRDALLASFYSKQGEDEDTKTPRDRVVEIAKGMTPALKVESIGIIAQIMGERVEPPEGGLYDSSGSAQRVEGALCHKGLDLVRDIRTASKKLERG